MKKIIVRLKDIVPQSLLLVVTFCIFMPCSLFLGNIDEFSVDFVKVVPIMVLVSGVSFLILCILAIVLAEKNIFRVYMVFIFSCAMGFYLQGNFLNPQFGVLNGNTIDWKEYTFNGIMSMLVWGTCIVAPQILIIYKKDIMRSVIKWGSYFVATVQILTLIVLVLSSSRTIENDFVLTKEGEFELSKNENIILFVVDTLDAQWFEDIIVGNEKYSENLKDFTYFDNAVAGGAPTILGIPLILTGEVYDTTTSLDQYYESAYEKSKLFKDLYTNNYKIKLYTGYEYLNHADGELISNCEDEQEYEISSYGDFAGCLYKLVAFYAMPQMLKQNFWLYSEEFSSYIAASNKELAIYSFDDSQFYKDYIESGISLESDENVFVMYHLFGSHGPYTMNEECMRVDSAETSLEQQTEGIFKIIFEYVEELKARGGYDSSTIIITADHGGTDLYQNPAILIKRSNASQEFVINSNPVTFQNLYASMASAFLGDSSAYGEDLFAVNNIERERLHTANITLGNKLYPDNEIINSKSYTQYVIVGNSRNPEYIGIKDNYVENIIDYKMGEIIDFRLSGENMEALKTGVGGIEQNGRWIMGNSLDISFNLSDYNGDNVVLNIEYSDLLTGRQTVQVYCKNNLIGEVVCTDDTGYLSFEIPKEYIIDNVVEISIKVPDAVRPSDISESTDSRKLSVRIKTLSIEVKNNSTSK